MVTNPYQIFGTQLRTRPNQRVVPLYGDETTTTTRTATTTYSQQQPQSSGLIATVAKQPGPSLSYYQQPVSHESDSMQTELETSSVRIFRSSEQPTSTSTISARPDFTKVWQYNRKHRTKTID